MAELKITNLDALLKKLKKNATMDDVKKAVTINGGELENRMKRNAVFKGHYRGKRFIKPTGATKRSINLKIDSNGLKARVAPTTHYSSYLEYGTRKMSAQPFVKPSYDVQKRKFISDLKRIMK